MEQRSEAWFEARKGRITGSAVGAILGLSPFSTTEDVMRRMVREYHGAESEFKGNVATEYGTINEPNALDDYMLESGNKVEEASFVMIADWLGASPDGLVDDKGLVEIKCPYGLRHDVDPKFKTLVDQPHYYAQIQIQLYVTQREWCDFYQWSPYGSCIERVDLDPIFLDENLPKLREFYERYLIERKPENAWRYLDGGELQFNYDRAKAMLEVAKSELDDAKQALIDATQGKGGKVGTLTITKVSKKGVIGYAKALKDIAPDADLEAYRGKDSEYWVIR